MKPRRLKIMGLNSFVDEQDIDFTLLTDKGFFGIFGPTGSGKSTILDAITIALYGEISRSSKNRMEFINSFRNDMNIAYEFEMGSIRDRKVYSIERHYKRKKDGGISCDRAILKEINGDTFDIISEGSNSVTESIIEIVGLKGDDFTRSVVLPQGRFSDFLKLTKSDRGKMLERILNLEEFGSKAAMKLKAEMNLKRSEMDIINGALSRYEGLTEEIYEIKKEELKRLIIEEVELKKEREVIEEQYGKFSVVWELQRELSVYEDRNKELHNLAEAIKDKNQVLNRAKQAQVVKPFLDNVNDTISRVSQSEERLRELSRQYDITLEVAKRTEKDYLEIYNKKDKMLPILIDREAKLVEALKLDEEIKKLDIEITAMRKGYLELKSEAVKIEEELKSILNEKEAALKAMDELEEKIGSRGITQEYRDKIIAALEVEKEFNEGNKKNTELHLRLQEMGAHIVKKKAEHEAVNGSKELMDRELNSLTERQRRLVETSPGDAASVYEKQILLEKMNNTLVEAVRDQESLAKITKELKELELSRTEVLKGLEAVQKELELVRAEISKLKCEIDDIEKSNMIGIIAENVREGEACPVCGSSHHPSVARKPEYLNLEEKRETLEKLNRSYEAALKKENVLNIELAGFDRELALKNQGYEEIKIRLNNINVIKYEEEKQSFELELVKLKYELDNHNRELKETEARAKELIDEKNRLELKFTEISTELSKDNEAFDVLKKEDLEQRDNLKSTTLKYEALKRELSIENIQEEYDGVKKWSQEEEAHRKQQLSLRQRVNELDILRNGIETKKAETIGKMESLRVSGQERNKIMTDFISKRDEYSEGKNPEVYVGQIREEIKSLRELEITLKSKFEEERNAQIKLSEERSREEKNVYTLKEVLLESERKLEKALKDNNFENAQMAIDSLISREIIANYETEINEYEDAVKSVRDNMLRINKKLDGLSIEEEAWELIVSSRRENENQRELCSKQIAGEKKDIERMEKDFDEIKILSKKKREKEHEQALLQDIQELIGGNKFVEFAAANQLKYISLEASRRLREITRGRYALELDSNNEFVMRDDFNGGVRRSADTLSGGETFLTSLCLALSLSSNIQLKGNSPLEFFFLDEGFGTLDIELLEVVISSLERLRSDRLCVGIISHVEELKSRVPIKLLVSPATIEGKGTKVLIEYS